MATQSGSLVPISETIGACPMWGRADVVDSVEVMSEVNKGAVHNKCCGPWLARVYPHLPSVLLSLRTPCPSAAMCPRRNS
jgi:hypothetical protein